jgi:hypothetical protein
LVLISCHTVMYMYKIVLSKISCQVLQNTRNVPHYNLQKYIYRWVAWVELAVIMTMERFRAIVGSFHVGWSFDPHMRRKQRFLCKICICQIISKCGTFLDIMCHLYLYYYLGSLKLSTDIVQLCTDNGFNLKPDIVHVDFEESMMKVIRSIFLFRNTT